MNEKAIRSRSFASGSDPDPLHSDDNRIPRLQIPQATALRPSVAHDDHSVHALVPNFQPLSAMTHQRALIGGGVEILGRAVVTLGCPKFRVTGIYRSASETQ